MKNETKQQKPFKAEEVLKAKNLIGKPSKVYEFKTSPTAYKVNPDGSISTAWDLNYFQ